MATNEIPGFLRSPKDYSFGLSLLKTVSSNKTLLSILEKGESVVNRKLLLIELNKYVTIPQNHVKKTTATEILPKRQTAYRNVRADIVRNSEEVRTEKRVPVRTESPDSSSSPYHADLLNRIHNQRKQLYATRGHLHGRLHEASTDQARYSIASELMSVQREIDKLNEDLDKAKSGVEIPKTVSLMTGEEVAAIERCKSYVRRYRNKLKKAKTEAEKQKFQAFLDRYQGELQKLIHG